MFKKILFLVLFVLSLLLPVSFALDLWADSKQWYVEYADVQFTQQVQTKEYTFDEFHCLYFFEDMDKLTEFSKHTRFVGQVPNLKIVDSQEYKVVISSHADALNNIKIGLTGEENFYTDGVSLVVTFADHCYVPVHQEDIDWDYDRGANFRLSQLNITVYAPIYTLRTDCSLKIDYQSPKCEKLYISLDNAVGAIHNVDTTDLRLFVSGKSNITLSGKATGEGWISIMHDTKIDANNFVAGKTTFEISSMIGGLSHIKYNNTIRLGWFSLSNIIFAFFELVAFGIIVLLPCLWMSLFVRAVRKSKEKQTKPTE